MSDKEAKSRIKINCLLEESGWRFFEKDGKPANIILENNTKITTKLLIDFGEDFGKTSKGYIDYLLLYNNGFPFILWYQFYNPEKKVLEKKIILIIII